MWSAVEAWNILKMSPVFKYVLITSRFICILLHACTSEKIREKQSVCVWGSERVYMCIREKESERGCVWQKNIQRILGLLTNELISLAYIFVCFSPLLEQNNTSPIPSPLVCVCVCVCKCVCAGVCAHAIKHKQVSEPVYGGFLGVPSLPLSLGVHGHALPCGPSLDHCLVQALPLQGLKPSNDLWTCCETWVGSARSLLAGVCSRNAKQPLGDRPPLMSDIAGFSLAANYKALRVCVCARRPFSGQP